MDHMSKSWMCSALPISTGTLKVLASGELMPFSLGGLLAFLSFYYIAINRFILCAKLCSDSGGEKRHRVGGPRRQADYNLLIKFIMS